MWFICFCIWLVHAVQNGSVLLQTVPKLITSLTVIRKVHDQSKAVFQENLAGIRIWPALAGYLEHTSFCKDNFALLQAGRKRQKHKMQVWFLHQNNPISAWHASNLQHMIATLRSSKYGLLQHDCYACYQLFEGVNLGSIGLNLTSLPAHGVKDYGN